MAIVQECRVHEVLTSKQEPKPLNSMELLLFLLSKADQALVLEAKKLRAELSVDLSEGKRFCFSVAQTSSNNISVQKRNSLLEHSSLSWPSLAQSLA